MIEPQQSAEHSLSAALERQRTQRIGTFIIILAVCDIPFALLGLIDLRNSPVTLAAALVAAAAFVAYYLLWRSGAGVPATYGCLLLLTLLIATGVHNTGGSLTAISMLYVLLLVGAGTVLNEPRALDLTLVACMVSYGGLALIELTIAPPLVASQLYTNTKPLPVISLIVAVLVSLGGVWIVLRRNMVGLRQAMLAQERARIEAEGRADENAELAAQVQASHASLLDTQAHLHDTIAALTLPLIPLRDGVALLALVGSLDARRAEQLIGQALTAVHQQRLRVVLVDLTGVTLVDAAVVQRIEQLTQAVQLLGARVLLTGIQASLAQALVAQQTGLAHLATFGRLQDGIAAVLAAEHATTIRAR